MATHSSILAWRIPGTGEPVGLLSMGSHSVGHDWSDLAAAVAASFGKPLMRWYRNGKLQVDSKSTEGIWPSLTCLAGYKISDGLFCLELPISNCFHTCWLYLNHYFSFLLSIFTYSSLVEVMFTSCLSFINISCLAFSPAGTDFSNPSYNLLPS